MKDLFQDFHQLEAGDGRRYVKARGSGWRSPGGWRRALGGDIEVRSREHEGSARFLSWSCHKSPGSQAATETPSPIAAGAIESTGALS